MRKHYTAAFKAQVVLELLKAERPVSKISSEYGVHANQLYQWNPVKLDERGAGPRKPAPAV